MLRSRPAPRRCTGPPGQDHGKHGEPVSQILSQMSGAAGSIFALPPVQMGLQLLGAYVVVLWLGAAFWAYRDMRRRTTDVIAPFASAALIVAFTPVLFPAAFLVHLVLRPPETLEERSEHALRRSILESEAVGTACPTCAGPVAEDWLLCPTCATRLRRRCPDCERLVELTWDVCAWCGRDFRPEPAIVSQPAAATSAPGPLSAGGGWRQPARLAEATSGGPAPRPGGSRSRRATVQGAVGSKLSSASSMRASDG